MLEGFILFVKIAACFIGFGVTYFFAKNFSDILSDFGDKEDCKMITIALALVMTLLIIISFGFMGYAFVLIIT